MLPLVYNDLDNCSAENIKFWMLPAKVKLKLLWNVIQCMARRTVFYLIFSFKTRETDLFSHSVEQLIASKNGLCFACDWLSYLVNEDLIHRYSLSSSNWHTKHAPEPGKRNSMAEHKLVGKSKDDTKGWLGMAFYNLQFLQNHPNKHRRKVKTMAFLCKCRFKTSSQDPLLSNQIVITPQATTL